MLRRQISFIGAAAIKRIGACNSVNCDPENFRIGQIVGATRVTSSCPRPRKCRSLTDAWLGGAGSRRLAIRSTSLVANGRFRVIAFCRRGRSLRLPPLVLMGLWLLSGISMACISGHIAVLKRAEDIAAQLGRPCAVLTFEPHPADFFLEPIQIFRLTPQETKAVALARAGIDGMIALTFDADLAAMRQKISFAIFSSDACTSAVWLPAMIFTLARAGRARRPFSPKLADATVFAVEIVERIAADSSGSIVQPRLPKREKRSKPAMWSGRKFCSAIPISSYADVVHGEKRGRDLGFPTANLRLHHSVRLRHGIYAVRCAHR